MNATYRLIQAATCTALLTVGCMSLPREREPSVFVQRRLELQQRAARGPSAIPDLAAALDDENLIIRRSAARLLTTLGASAAPELGHALDNEDFLVRRIAVLGICRLPAENALPYMEKALGDENEMVRQVVVDQLVSMHPQTAAIRSLLERASKDTSPSVRNPAAAAIWPFHREVTSIRDRKDWDHDVQVIQAIQVPKDAWKFTLDPARSGHKADWFKPGFDDSAWDSISIEQAWQKAGYDYIGVSWYRRWIEAPDRPEHLAVELHFKGVDECAWVWLNGHYVGQHDIGPDGWNKPFTLDVTQEIQWGQKNQITVRVMNTAYAGGIWQPIFIEVLK